MFEQYLRAWTMTLSTLLIALLLYVSRRKKYQIKWIDLILIMLVFTVTGSFGASIASLFAQGEIGGRRAYGTVLGNTLGIFLLLAIPYNRGKNFTDYAAIPTMATYCVAKANCIFGSCCYGIELYRTTQGEIIRFPSPLLETISLALITVWLLYMENKHHGTKFLWELNVLWFGVYRYVADLFRGDPDEVAPYFFRMPAGQFWSIVVIFTGLILIDRKFRCIYNRKPENKELINALIGKYPED